MCISELVSLWFHLLQEKEASEQRPAFVEPEEENELLKTQGVAPRKSHLQMKSSFVPVPHTEMRGARCSVEEDEVQSNLNEVRFIEWRWYWIIADIY